VIRERRTKHVDLARVSRSQELKIEITTIRTLSQVGGRRTDLIDSDDSKKKTDDQLDCYEISILVKDSVLLDWIDRLCSHQGKCKSLDPMQKLCLKIMWMNTDMCLGSP
jgi:hypothetical protein